MSKYWAWQLQRTILEDKEDDKVKDSFLDPWTSLDPDFTLEKLSPDIISVFKDSDDDFPSWLLIYPKRSYLPSSNPHLQLWYVSKEFAPSFHFVDQGQKVFLAEIVDQVREIYKKLGHKLTLAINATPFSFIKNDEGRYFAGGQSVRTFHLHFLAIPENLEKQKISDEEAVLVYPTDFSKKLFSLIFVNPDIQSYIFGDVKPKFVDYERGVEFTSRGSLKSLIEIINKIDELMYQVQLSLIYSFYVDSEEFLDKISDFARTNDLEKMKNSLQELILVGNERTSGEVKLLVDKEIHRLGAKFGTSFAQEDIDDLVSCLVADESGDLASTFGSQKVVLRPGMGYGTMIKLDDKNYEISLVPLDSLKSEGIMESSGYNLTKKEIIHKKPSWLKEFLKFL